MTNFAGYFIHANSCLILAKVDNSNEHICDTNLSDHRNPKSTFQRHSTQMIGFQSRKLSK